MSGHLRNRREVIALGATAAFATLPLSAKAMTSDQLNFKPDTKLSAEDKGANKPVRFGQDASGRHATDVDLALPFKVPTDLTKGDLFIFEDGESMSAEDLFQGGIPEHVHHSQDEFFYVLEGEVTIEIARIRYVLRPGDCILGPRKIPHTWAFSTLGKNRVLIAFTPAGQMEDFFFKAKEGSPHLGDPDFMEAHGMTVVGPPLVLKHKP